MSSNPSFFARLAQAFRILFGGKQAGPDSGYDLDSLQSQQAEVEMEISKQQRNQSAIVSRLKNREETIRNLLAKYDAEPSPTQKQAIMMQLGQAKRDLDADRKRLEVIDDGVKSLQGVAHTIQQAIVRASTGNVVSTDKLKALAKQVDAILVAVEEATRCGADLVDSAGTYNARPVSANDSEAELADLRASIGMDPAKPNVGEAPAVEAPAVAAAKPSPVPGADPF